MVFSYSAGQESRKISNWATFRLVCGGNWAGSSALALQPSVLYLSHSTDNWARTVYTFSMSPGR